MWDKEKPQDTEPISFGDDRIRELKNDLENALQIEHHFPVDNLNVKLLPKVYSGEIPPEGLLGRIYYNTLPSYRTFFIFNNNEWVPMSNNFYTIPTDTYLVASTSGVFMHTVTLTTRYALRISNQWLTNLDFYVGADPTNLSHNHIVNNVVFGHSHTTEIYTPEAHGADADCNWFMDTQQVPNNQHVHRLHITLNGIDIEHNHILNFNTINLRHYTLRVVRVEY